MRQAAVSRVRSLRGEAASLGIADPPSRRGHPPTVATGRPPSCSPTSWCRPRHRVRVDVVPDAAGDPEPFAGERTRPAPPPRARVRRPYVAARCPGRRRLPGVPDRLAGPSRASYLIEGGPSRISQGERCSTPTRCSRQLMDDWPTWRSLVARQIRGANASSSRQLAGALARRVRHGGAARHAKVLAGVATRRGDIASGRDRRAARLWPLGCRVVGIDGVSPRRPAGASAASPCRAISTRGVPRTLDGGTSRAVLRRPARPGAYFTLGTRLPRPTRDPHELVARPRGGRAVCGRRARSDR